jgi:uncharacterized protein (TIGR02594 family)
MEEAGMADPERLQSDDPPWLKIAFEELEEGVHRTAGPAATDRIVEYLEATTIGSPSNQDDATYWCSAFCVWVMQQAGYTSTKSAWARSWLDWGKEIDDRPERGAITVFSRGPTHGHVAFYLAQTSTTIKVLGGNQGNAVSIADQDRSNFLGYRWPSDYEEADMTPEQASQLKKIYNALIVPGTTSPEQTVNLLFERIRNIEDALTVPGTTTAEEAFDKLFARVRRIESMLADLVGRSPS